MCIRDRDKLAWLRETLEWQKENITDYIEMQGNYTVSMSVFDSLYEEYTEWLKF